MNDPITLFDQTVIYGERTHDNIQIIKNDQGDNYTSGCLLNHPYFKKDYKMIATDLRK